MNVVFIVSRFPYPLEKGDKLRAYQHILNLHREGVKVHLVAISDTVIDENSFAKLKPYCAGIQILRFESIK